jgi:hypothetical protein
MPISKIGVSSPLFIRLEDPSRLNVHVMPQAENAGQSHLICPGEHLQQVVGIPARLLPLDSEPD